MKLKKAQREAIKSVANTAAYFMRQMKECERKGQENNVRDYGWAVIGARVAAFRLADNFKRGYIS